MTEKFDAYAREYDALHKASIGASGEDPDYFHRYKIERLKRLNLPAGPLLDYGCGIGNLTTRFAQSWDEVHAFDPSEESVGVARARAPSATFYSDPSALPEAYFAVAVLAGVLHHISPSERASVLANVRRSLRPGGAIVIFEHNPINPLTRKAVADCPFDDDAILLWPHEARRLLRQSHYGRVTLEYIVFFPRQLRFLRPLEPWLAFVPVGAQQMLVGYVS